MTSYKINRQCADLSHRHLNTPDIPCSHLFVDILPSSLTMLVSLALSTLLYFSSVSASPIASRACTAMLAGNLSPNGNGGNFKMLDGSLVWDPNEIQTGFDVSLMNCGTAEDTSSSNPTGVLQGPSGQCLSVVSDSTVQSITCPSNAALSTASMTWSMFDGFLFWSGPVNSECPSGLYGYIASDASGIPAAPQDTPTTLGCLTANNVFGFSLLI